MEPKPIYLALMVAIFGIVFISGCAQQKFSGQNGFLNNKTLNDTDFLNYNNSEHGIRIKYPSDWGFGEQVKNDVVLFLSPVESSSDIFRENLNILIETLSTDAQPKTLDEYTKLSIEEIKKYINDVNIIDSGSTTLDGNPAYKVVYTGKYLNYELKWMQVWTIKNNKAYILTYAAAVEGYTKYLDKINQMIGYFDIV